MVKGGEMNGGGATREQGSILLVVMILMFLITMIAFTSMNNSVSEMKIAGNDRLAKRDFYNAEAGVFQAVGNFEQIYTNSPRLYGTAGDPSELPLRDRPIDSGGIAFASPVVGGTGVPVAWIEVRAILLSGNKKGSGLSSGAELTPSIVHVGPAPAGFDKATYRSRRYAITATAIDPKKYNASDPMASLTHVVIQSGVDMGEELVKVVHLVGQ